MHRPERWGILQFAQEQSGPVALKPYPGWQEREELAEVWDAEQKFYRRNGRFTSLPEDLGLTKSVQIQATDRQFEAIIGGFSVDQTLRFRQVNP
jgi:hypothetical protein